MMSLDSWRSLENAKRAGEKKHEAMHASSTMESEALLRSNVVRIREKERSKSGDPLLQGLPQFPFRGNRTKLFAQCGTCRDYYALRRQEAPLCHPVLESATISEYKITITAKRVAAEESFVATAKASKSFVETDGREPMKTCDRVPLCIVSRGARVATQNPRKYSDQTSN